MVFVIIECALIVIWDIQLKSANGEIIHIEYKGKGSISDDIYSLSGVIMNINNEKNTEQKVHFMSYYDDITGIPNRKMFTEKFQELINNNSNSKSQLGIIFLILIILKILMIHMDMK